MPKKFLKLLVFLATLLTLLPCFASDGEKSFKTLNDFSGARFSTLNGTVADKLTQSVIPNSDNFVYYYTVADGIMALKSNKVDAFVLDDPICRLAAARNPEVMVFHEPVMPDQYGFAFPKGSPLRNKFNTVLRKFSEDGTLQNLRDIWLGADESKKVLLKQDWPGKNGTIRYYHDYLVEPIVYVGADGPLGLEIDLALRIAKELDMKIELTNDGPFTLVLDSDELFNDSVELAKKYQDKVVVKSAYFEEKRLDANGVKALAAIPSKQQLYGMLASALLGVPRALAIALNQVAEKNA